MWKTIELGNRIQSFSSLYSRTDKEEIYSDKTSVTLIIINVDSNVMCWNPSYGEIIEEDGFGRGWIFSTPSTPRFVAADLIQKENVYLVIYSSCQTQQTKNAIVKIINEIVCSGASKNKIAGISGGSIIEASSFCIVNFEKIFYCALYSEIKLIICPSWEEESVEYKKVENGTNFLLFHKSNYHNISFYDRLIDQIKYRHRDGELFIDKIKKENCEEINFFESANEIISSNEAAFDSLVGHSSNFDSIVFCGHPGGELESAVKKLVFKLEKREIPVSVFDQRMCVGLKAGIKKYKDQLFNDVVVNRKKVIFASSNIRRSERDFLTKMIHSFNPNFNVLIALVTKPSWWNNSRKNLNPLSHQSLKSYSLFFDPPDYNKENNVVRLI